MTWKYASKSVLKKLNQDYELVEKNDGVAIYKAQLVELTYI